MKKNTFKREIIVTEDGSHTLFIPELNEHYHSTHGAIQESMHIFIKSGLEYFDDKRDVNILEVGFGTGLNAFLTCVEAERRGVKINFSSVEKYPITIDEFEKFNYSDRFETKHKEYFKQIHLVTWGEFKEINVNFKLQKVEVDLLEFAPDSTYDLVYFDAFGPDVQPKMWTEDVFRQMYSCMNSGGVLVTYSAKGQVRRNMQSAGFTVERLPGPPGKREMLRAIKTISN